MRAKLPMLMVAGVAILFSMIRTGASGQEPLPSSGTEEVPKTLAAVANFVGAENRNCPTGAGMFALLGSRAVLTVPQIPSPTNGAVPTDVDNIFFGDNTIFRGIGLPDHSGEIFEFVGKTCTIQITIRYK
jgi:hypothetical protein